MYSFDACKYSGFEDLIVYLLEHGADKDIEDKDGKLAIHYIRQHSFEALKDYLNNRRIDI